MRVFLPLKLSQSSFFPWHRQFAAPRCAHVSETTVALLFLPFSHSQCNPWDNTRTLGRKHTHTCTIYSSSVATSCLFFWFFMSIFPRHTCDSKLCVYVAVPVWQFECAAVSQIERFGKSLSTWPSNGGQNNYNNFSWSLWGHLNGLYSLDLHA